VKFGTELQHGDTYALFVKYFLRQGRQLKNMAMMRKL